MIHFNHFDFLAPLYDRLIKPPDGSKVRSLAGLPIRGLLLDVGGGTGSTSFMLKNWVTGIVIADSSLGMLEQAMLKTVSSLSVQIQSSYLSQMKHLNG